MSSELCGERGGGIGVMEWWSNGTIASLHYSITPLLHYSPLHHDRVSITGVLGAGGSTRFQAADQPNDHQNDRDDPEEVKSQGRDRDGDLCDYPNDHQQNRDQNYGVFHVIESRLRRWSRAPINRELYPIVQSLSH